MTPRVVISVRGGVIESVYCSDGQMEVEVFDWDDIDEECTNVLGLVDCNKVESQEEEFDEAIADLFEVW